MKFSYYPDTDTLYIDLRYKPGADVLEIADDFVVDVDEDGVPVGMEIEHARQHTNLLHLKVEGPSLDLDLETSRSARAASSSRQTKTGPALEGEDAGPGSAVTFILYEPTTRKISPK